MAFEDESDTRVARPTSASPTNQDSFSLDARVSIREEIGRARHRIKDIRTELKHAKPMEETQGEFRKEKLQEIKSVKLQIAQWKALMAKPSLLRRSPLGALDSANRKLARGRLTENEAMHFSEYLCVRLSEFPEGPRAIVERSLAATLFEALNSTKYGDNPQMQRWVVSALDKISVAELARHIDPEIIYGLENKPEVVTAFYFRTFARMAKAGLHPVRNPDIYAKLLGSENPEVRKACVGILVAAGPRVLEHLPDYIVKAMGAATARKTQESYVKSLGGPKDAEDGLRLRVRSILKAKGEKIVFGEPKSDGIKWSSALLGQISDEKKKLADMRKEEAQCMLRVVGIASVMAELGWKGINAARLSGAAHDKPFTGDTAVWLASIVSFDQMPVGARVSAAQMFASIDKETLGAIKPETLAIVMDKIGKTGASLANAGGDLANLRDTCVAAAKNLNMVTWLFEQGTFKTADSNVLQSKLDTAQFIARCTDISALPTAQMHQIAATILAGISSAEADWVLAAARMAAQAGPYREFEGKALGLGFGETAQVISSLEGAKSSWAGKGDNEITKKIDSVLASMKNPSSYAPAHEEVSASRAMEIAMRSLGLKGVRTAFGEEAAMRMKALIAERDRASAQYKREMAKQKQPKQEGRRLGR